MSKMVADGVRGTMGHSTMSVKLEAGINAISASRNSSQVVVAGRSVFKIFDVEETCFREKLDLRVGRITLKYSCNDVAWHPLKDELLATGATNGHVFTWNLNKRQGNKLDQEFADHSRTVNRICFHPTEWHVLLSGSQDGTMKYFDLRTNQCEATFGQPNESVRDIQFNPNSYFTFASTSDSGNVQLWDFRRADRMLLNFMAHNGPAFSLDWHPEDKNLVATCGRDKQIKVWRLENECRLTAEHTVYCMASVARVKWRPEKRFQIASCSQVIDQTVCVWDIRRPFMPYAVFDEHKDVATGIAWRDPHVFLSGGKDAMLYQHIFKEAKRPAESLSPVGVSFSIFGNICHALSKSTQPEGQTLSTTYSSTRKPMSFRRHGHKGHPELFTPYESSMFVYNHSDKGTFSDLFLESAHRFKLTGLPFADLCEHNASVSQQLGRHQVAQTWNMLKLIYIDEPMDKDGYQTLVSDGHQKADREKGLEKSLSQTTDPHSHTVESATGQTDDDSALSDSELEHGHMTAFKARQASHDSDAAADFFFGEQVRVDGNGDIDEVYDDDFTGLESWSLPNEAFTQRHEINDTYKPPSPDRSQYTLNVESLATERPFVKPDSISLGNQILAAPAINPAVAKQQPFLQLSAKLTPIVVDMLNFYANQGDVQMAVSALIVLGDRIRDKISSETREQWFMSYIDLLTCFKLWCIASEVTKLSHHEAVESINQQSTTVYTKCNHCSGQLEKVSWACHKKCRKLTNTCSVCHLPVKGLYVWCQGCSHGGHIQHIQEWLQKNQTCPTGCGHLCEYT